MYVKSLPRGIRNNNPGNIRLTKTRWQGQKPFQFDNAFVEFETPVMGLRALMKTLLTYYRKYGLDSVQAIVNRWAPPHENATDYYAHHVARRLNVKRGEIIDVENPVTLTALARAITIHENGRPPKPLPELWFDEDIYNRACALALNHEKEMTI